MNTIPIKLIIASFEEQLSQIEQSKLNSWLSESEENQRQYNELRKIYQTSGKLRVDFQPNESKALQKVNRRLKTKRFVRWSQTAAAAIVLLFIITKAFLLISPEVKWQELTASSQQTIFLSDSSKIVLAENTHIKYPDRFSKNERTIFLQGRAYFEVRPNKKAPFLIHTPNNTVRVLGTKFLVDATNANMEQVVVDEGTVSFGSPDTLIKKPIILNKQETGTWSAEKKDITKQSNPDINKNSRLSGKLIFRDVELKDVIKDLERHYEVKIELADKNSEWLRVSGVITNSSIDETLKIVCMITNLSVERNGETYILKL